ncbi:MAG: OmpA family protein [Sulfurovum sp.]|nr:OmpA family protein [Sulfurovum sp.]
MFKKDSTAEEDNFWISYADLMAGLLFVFILLIGAIISKSIILKSDLHTQKDTLSTLSKALKEKERSLNNLNDTLLKSKVIIDEQSSYINENKALLSQKDSEISDSKALLSNKALEIEAHTVLLSEQEKLLTQKEAQLEKDKRIIEAKDTSLAHNERILKLKIEDIAKLNQMLLASKNREVKLNNKIVIVQRVLSKNKTKLAQSKQAEAKNTKQLKDYEGKVIILSNQLTNASKTAKLQDEKLLEILNAVDEKKTKYDKLLSNLQSQKAKIKSLTGIKLRVVAALKSALGDKIDIDKKTGSLRLASNILFDSGYAKLKPEAKIELKKAFEDYIGTLVENREIKPHLDKIIIEGHTDSDGPYIYNLNLSQKRALAVMEYLLTLDFTKKHNIRPLMIASGRAYLDLISSNGREDKEASRRIEIKFRLKNEEAMNEIEKVLDAD